MILQGLKKKVYTNSFITPNNTLRWKREKYEKLKLTSDYLDDMTLHWHQNFIMSNGNQEVT